MKNNSLNLSGETWFNTSQGHQNLSTLDVIIGIWIPGLLCFFGILGNLMCLIVLQKHHRTTQRASAPFLSLKALAVTDFLLLATAFIQQVLPFVCDYSRSDNIFCLKWIIYFKIYSWPVVCMAQMASVWTTVLVSAERFIVICSSNSSFLQVFVYFYVEMFVKKFLKITFFKS